MIAAKPLTKKELWTTSGNRKVPNIDKLRKHLLREGHLEKEDLMDLIKEATKILSKCIFGFIIFLYRKRAKRNEAEGASHYYWRHSRAIL
jgi:hypothetical protein